MNSLEINPIKQRIHENGMRLTALRGYFDVAAKQERLEEVLAELQQPEIWQQPERATQLGKERVTLEQVLHPVSQLERGLQDIESLLELTLESADPMLLTELQQELTNSETQLAKLEFQRMFAKPQDSADCYLDLQAGSGGTEAQDWTEMLLRMYLRWSEAKGFQCEIIDYNPGEVAGVKSATVKVIGAYAYGWLRTEIGVHRLVRKSPFDAGNRRHTSFSAAFVYPEVADDIEITINPADCRIDVYRASGAGGQHVNRTESAVRITHLPTNIVVQCQNDRSQHKNREQCLRQLRAKLYEWEQQKQLAEKQAVEASKADIGWGSQIRSYVLDDARIKDLRTGVETRNTQAVLDGDLDHFIEASLQAGL